MYFHSAPDNLLGEFVVGQPLRPLRKPQRPLRLIRRDFIAKPRG